MMRSRFETADSTRVVEDKVETRRDLPFWQAHVDDVDLITSHQIRDRSNKQTRLNEREREGRRGKEKEGDEDLAVNVSRISSGKRRDGEDEMRLMGEKN